MMYIKPTDDHLTKPFWKHLADGRLCLERCVSCKTFRHPPSPICPKCHSFDSEWVEPQGDATLYSFTIVRHPVHPAVESWVPYAVGLATLPEGVRMVGRIDVPDPSLIRIGMALKVELLKLAPDFSLPVYKPAP